MYGLRYSRQCHQRREWGGRGPAWPDRVCIVQGHIQLINKEANQAFLEEEVSC